MVKKAEPTRVDWVVDVWVQKERDWRLGTATSCDMHKNTISVDVETAEGSFSGVVCIDFTNVRLVECADRTNEQSKYMFDNIVVSCDCVLSN